MVVRIRVWNLIALLAVSLGVLGPVIAPGAAAVAQASAVTGRPGGPSAAPRTPAGAATATTSATTVTTPAASSGVSTTPTKAQATAEATNGLATPTASLTATAAPTLTVMGANTARMLATAPSPAAAPHVRRTRSALLSASMMATGTVTTSTAGSAPASAQMALTVPSVPGGLTWNTSRTALPQSLFRPAVATGQDGNIYVFGGTDGSSVDYATTYIYHPGTNTWTQGASMPVAREGARAVTLPDGRIAVLGGGTHCWYTNLCDAGTI